MKQVGRLTPEERPEAGKLANLIKVNLTERYEAVEKVLLMGKVSGDGSFGCHLARKKAREGAFAPYYPCYSRGMQDFLHDGISDCERP